MKKFSLSLGFLLALVSSVSFAASAKKDLKAPDLTFTEFKKLVDEKAVVVIDANSDESFKKAHIPGAIHFASNKESLASKLPAQKDALIVAYCGGKMCSAWEEAAKKVKDLGYTNVKHYSAGITGWKKNKGPTEAGV